MISRGTPPGPPPPQRKLPKQTPAKPIKVRLGGTVHRHTLEAALGSAQIEELSWGTDYGPPILPTTLDMLWGPIFGPDGTGLAKLRDSDIFVELGCGQGKVLLAAHASAPLCRIVGVEIDAAIAAKARAEIRAAVSGDAERHISVICSSIDDCFGHVCDVAPGGLGDRGMDGGSILGQASVVFLFLSQYAMFRLRPRLLEVLQVGARILCRQFHLGMAWPADAEVYGSDGKTLFRLYTVTAERKKDLVLLSDSDLLDEYGLSRAQRPSHAAF